MIDETAMFASSVDLDSHPMEDAKARIKQQYYLVLEELVKKQLDNKYTAARLEQYRAKLLMSPDPVPKDARTENRIEKTARSVINSHFRPWRKKYRYWLMCDAALILLDEGLINNAASQMCSYMTKRQGRQFGVLLKALKEDAADTAPVLFAEGLISQYRRNRAFACRPLKKLIVTANMSAGKSTLINALVGKPLTKTSQEVCTGNLCYLYNKPYEDRRVHLENGAFTNHASQGDLRDISWDVQTSIASYFRGIEDIRERFCIIDTPGVNSAIHRKHGRMTREALRSGQYEKVLCILNANKLGTDEEIAHMKWIAENVPKEKAIFILNKLDDFKAADDDIAASVEGVKGDLISLGFGAPAICPVSAYFALLIKMKENGDEMTEDEEEEYSLYLKKFKRPAYDLSKYYEGVHEEEGEGELISMSKKCGLYGLEKRLFGGTR